MTTPQRGYQSPDQPGRLPKLPTGPAEAGGGATAPPDIPAIANIQPGQRIMLIFKRTLSQVEVQRLLSQAEARYPDVEFGILTGVDGVVILPPSEETGAGHADTH